MTLSSLIRDVTPLTSSESVPHSNLASSLFFAEDREFADVHVCACAHTHVLTEGFMETAVCSIIPIAIRCLNGIGLQPVCYLYSSRTRVLFTHRVNLLNSVTV